ncbi:MAG: hypothetical protein R3D05_14585 [Dongiaceae bacterium]
MVDRVIALYGTTETLPDRIELKAGAISATLENGALRWIRLGDIEVLRGIAFLVRDRNWSTPGPAISDLKIAQDDSRFRVSFKALCRTDDGALPWSAEITGDADGTLRFIGTARPESDFVTNRTGFVVLHPLEGVAGCPVEVTHVDGAKRRARFPAFVDPEQCFFDIRALAHEVTAGIWATCTMEGDTWEMEDHRNWLDASFKTYVRPLSLPYPYTLKAFESVTQTVTLTLSKSVSAPRPVRVDPAVEIAVNGDLAQRMPAIGLRAPLQWMGQAREAADLLRIAGPQLVNGRIDPRAGHGAKEMSELGSVASALGAALTLELVVPCRDDPATEIAAFAAQLRSSGVRPESILIAAAEDRIRQEPGAPPPPLALLAEIYRAARAALTDIPIGGGTFCFFTELNRNWPPIGLIDYIAHTSCSVVHAFDDRAMMENLESFAHIFRTVRAFAGEKPYRLVAASLGLETGTSEAPDSPPQNVRGTLARMDPRHRGLFGAAWTVASIGAAARGGLSAITPAALVGEFGIVRSQLPWQQPWFDTHDAPAVYPVFHVIAGMARAAGRSVVDAVCSDATRISALAYREADGRVTLWLANLRDASQRVALAGMGEATQLAQLDEKSFEAAVRNPAFMREQRASGSATFELSPYGVARIQWEK